MATGDYCTIAEAKAYIGLSPETAELDALIATIIAAVSREIDGWCNRRFYTTSADETRYYTADADDGCDDGVLWLRDDLISVTTLQTDDDADGTHEDTWAATDYKLCPLNAALRVRPYTWIETTPNGAYSFPVGVQAGVKIVGKFGYSTTTPEVVKAACLLQVSRVYNRKSAPFGVMGSADMGQISVIPKIDPDIEQMLKGLRRV